MTTRVMLPVVLFFALCAVNAEAGELKGIWLNHEGVRAFKEERANDSYNYFAQSLAELPFSPEAHFNLGTTYYVNKEFEKAQKEFEQAADLAKVARNDEAQFLSLYNAGVTATDAKQFDAALDAYQRALAIKPDSLEVKTNIELLSRSESGGGGEDDKDKEKKPSEGGDDQQKQQQSKQQQPNQKKQPKPFDSKEMSQQDVNKIVEELKRQEEQIRAKFQNEKMKSAPNEKDW